MRLEITDTRTLTDETPNVRDLEFHNTPVAIGSHSANVVQLPDMDIAPYHAMILPVGDDRWVYQPTTLDSSIQINGRRVSGKVGLEDGDILEITHFSIKFTLDIEPELSLPEPGNVDELAKIRQFPLPPRSEVRKAEADISLNPVRQKAVAEYTLRLRSCPDFAALLEQTVPALLTELGARSVWMGVRREAMGPLEFIDGRSDQGKHATEPKNIDTFVYRCLTRHQFISIPRTGDAETQSVLAVPIMGRRGALGLIYADTHRRTRIFDEADLDFVTLIAQIVACHLEAIINEQVEQRTRIGAGELSLLQQVQARLDPRGVPQWPQLQIAAFAKPGAERCGDLCDIMRLPNGLAAFLMGHVEAQTTRAALALAEVRSSFRISGLHADPPHVQLKALNWLLYDEKDACRLDIAILVTNPKTGAAEYCTAGGIGLVIVDSRGNARKLGNSASPAVGESKQSEFAASTCRIQNGDTIALYSPGCLTAKSETGEPVGEERFMDALCDGFGQAASATLDGLLADLPFFKTGRPPDDISILLVHRNAE